jgi:hypothetical protein
LPGCEIDEDALTVLHPHTELAWYGPEIGHGVRATRAIPRGTMVWVLCPLDIVLAPSDVDALPAAHRPLVERYAYLDAQGRWVLCWDNARYVNHHCDANARGLGHWGQIAIRDIALGEEITCDYGECNLDSELDCACTASSCRGRIHGSDLVRLAHAWDRELATAIAAAAGLEQPLLAYLSEHQRGQLLAVLEGRAPAPSIRVLGFDSVVGARG